MAITSTLSKVKINKNVSYRKHIAHQHSSHEKTYMQLYSTFSAYSYNTIVHVPE